MGEERRNTRDTEEGGKGEEMAERVREVKGILSFPPSLLLPSVFSPALWFTKYNFVRVGGEGRRGKEGGRGKRERGEGEMKRERERGEESERG